MEDTHKFPVTSSDKEGRTSLSLSLSVSDKKALKILAAKRGTTVAAIIHEWIAEHTKETDRPLP